jgi:hypothetical protein
MFLLLPSDEVETSPFDEAPTRAPIMGIACKSHTLRYVHS